MRSTRTALLAVLALISTAGLLAAPASGATPPPPGGGGPAAGSYDDRTLIVAFRLGTPADTRRHAHRVLGAEVQSTWDWLDADVVRLPRGLSAADAAPRYERHPHVAYTDFNWRYTTSAPNDPLFPDQWGLHNTGQPVTGSSVLGVPDVDIDAPEGWEIAFGPGQYPSGGGTRVGVLDTGIDRTHVDLLGKTRACATATAAVGVVVEGSCSDDNLHGTHVAGTISTHTDNGLGVAGVAPDAEFAIVKALNAAGVGFYADIVAGLRWLRTSGGAQVINMSIGGPQDTALDRELREAARAGVLLIAAAGNSGDDSANYPAFHPDVVSVSAVDAAGRRARFSTCNSDVEIAAPGVDIWSTFPGNAYGVISGTSMAAPHVSGVAALVMSETGRNAEQTRSTLVSSATGDGGCNGAGIVNLASALTTPTG